MHFEKVHAVNHDLLDRYTPDAYTIVLRQLVQKVNPFLTIFPHTYQVRDFAPKLATALGRVLVSDCVGHRVENGRVTLVRQLFQGKINADVHFVGEPALLPPAQQKQHTYQQQRHGDDEDPVRVLPRTRGVQRGERAERDAGEQRPSP